jgi:hypothetical protein
MTLVCQEPTTKIFCSTICQSKYIVTHLVFTHLRSATICIEWDMLAARNDTSGCRKGNKQNIVVTCQINESINEPVTHSLSHSVTQSLSHSGTQSLSHSITQSLNHSITQSLNHSITHSLTHSHTQSLTHSLTHSLTQ